MSILSCFEGHHPLNCNCLKRLQKNIISTKQSPTWSNLKQPEGARILLPGPFLLRLRMSLHRVIAAMPAHWLHRKFIGIWEVFVMRANSCFLSWFRLTAHLAAFAAVGTALATFFGNETTAKCCDTVRSISFCSIFIRGTKRWRFESLSARRKCVSKDMEGVRLTMLGNNLVASVAWLLLAEVVLAGIAYHPVVDSHHIVVVGRNPVVVLVVGNRRRSYNSESVYALEILIVVDFL